MLLLLLKKKTKNGPSAIDLKPQRSRVSARHSAPLQPDRPPATENRAKTPRRVAGSAKRHALIHQSPPTDGSVGFSVSAS